MRLLMSRTLTREGYVVTEARTAKEAHALACAQHPDLMVLDVLLPDESGLDLLSRLRKIPALEQTPVVLVTAASQVFAGLAPEAFGADRCLTKPFTQAELSSAVDELLSTHQTDAGG